MAAISNELIRAISVGYQTIFNNAFEQASNDYQAIARTVSSTHEIETYGFSNRNTTVRLWEGDRFVQGMSGQSYQVKNKPYEGTLAVEREKIEDDSYSFYNDPIMELGYAAKTLPDELLFGLLKNGTVDECHDGLPFFSASHKVGKLTQSNYGGGSGEAWYLIDDTTPVLPLIWQVRKQFQFIPKNLPTDDNNFWDKELLFGIDGRFSAAYGRWQKAYCSKQSLTLENYIAARTAMQKLTDEAGRPIIIRPSLLVVSPSLEAQARLILNAQYIPNAAGTATQTNTYMNTAKLLVTQWLN